MDETSSNSSKSIQKILYKNDNSNFKAHNVLTTFFDLNINNNPRVFKRQYFQINKEKYIPIYYTNNYPNKKQIKETYFPDIIELNNTDKIYTKKEKSKKILSLKYLQNCHNNKKYKKNEKKEGLLSPNLREDIQNNTKNLIDRINMNYDIGK